MLIRLLPLIHRNSFLRMDMNKEIGYRVLSIPAKRVPIERLH